MNALFPAPEKCKMLFLSAYTGPEGKRMMWSGPNFGLYRMKFYLEHKFPGIEIDVVDPSIIDVDFKKLEYNLIGFSPCHETLEHDISLMYEAQARCPNALLVAGGIHATFVHKWLLREAPLDFVVLGEGEIPMENFLKKYDAERGIASIAEVPGISTLDFPTPLTPNLTPEQFSFMSRIFDFKRVPYLTHWDANAGQYENPDWEAVRTVRIFTGNYCPWNCSFCSSTNFLDFAAEGDFSFEKNTKVVTLTGKELYEMVERVVRARPETRTIIFDDDNFVMSMTRLIEMCNMLIEGKANGSIPKGVTFICQARIDNFKSKMAKNALSLMKSAGFRMIMYGVESLSEPVLKEFYKNTPPALIHEVLEDTLRVGIKPLFYLILFSPGSTMDDVRTTVLASLPYLEKKLEVTLNFYVQDLPGTHYAKQEDLRRNNQTIPIHVDGKRVHEISKSTYIFPTQQEVWDFAESVLNDYPRYLAMFKKKFGIEHTPGRVYTFIIFYAILEKLGCDKEKDRVLEVFEAEYAQRV